MRTGTKDLIGIQVIVQDVTERKRAERALFLANEKLRQANGDLEQFAYSASHDLRSPLRAIGQMASWITEDHGKELPEEVRRDLGLIERRVRRMQPELEQNVIGFEGGVGFQFTAPIALVVLQGKQSLAGAVKGSADPAGKVVNLPEPQLGWSGGSKWGGGFFHNARQS